MHPLLFAIFGGFLIGAGITADFERAAGREIAGTLQGKPNVRVRTRASFGALAGEMVAVRIEASKFETDGLPFFAEPHRSKAGKIGRLEISLKDFYLKGLAVKKLETTIPHCRYDRTLALTKKRFRLSESGEGVGRVEVEAASLEKFARTKFKGIKDLRIALANDVCTVEGEGDFFLFRGKFRVDARLASIDGRKIELVESKMILNGEAATESLSKALIGILNPILDLDKDLGLQGAMDVTSIRLNGNVMTAEGRARIPSLPAATAQ